MAADTQVCVAFLIADFPLIESYLNVIENKVALYGESFCKYFGINWHSARNFGKIPQ